ncbi:hypothetical protein GCM10027203_44860 [Nonomuraea fastidiosa]
MSTGDPDESRIGRPESRLRPWKPRNGVGHRKAGGPNVWVSHLVRRRGRDLAFTVSAVAL